MPTPAEVLRAVADPVRLAVLGHAATGPVDVDALAASLGVATRDVLSAVGRLRGIGLLRDDLALDTGALRQLGAALPSAEPPSAGALAGPWTDEEGEVLARFFSGDRLHTIPTNRNKRLVVLERLAQEFELGVRYQERQVNFTLQLFHPDYAALRRHLVDEGFLTRADGVYWRTGGRVDQLR